MVTLDVPLPLSASSSSVTEEPGVAGSLGNRVVSGGWECGVTAGMLGKGPQAGGVKGSQAPGLGLLGSLGVEVAVGAGCG